MSKNGDQAMTLQQLAEAKEGGGCSAQTLRRSLEDLVIHNVLAQSKPGQGKGADRWTLSEWAKRQWELGYPEGYEGCLGERNSMRE